MREGVRQVGIEITHNKDASKKNRGKLGGCRVCGDWAISKEKYEDSRVGGER